MSFKRSQGLQFYRDAAYQVCQAYLKGLIRVHGRPCPHCFLMRLRKLEGDAIRLINEEVHHGFYAFPPGEERETTIDDHD